MEQRFGIRHDADVAFPEDKVAAPEEVQILRRQPFAEACLLHVGIAQGSPAASLECELHEARAVKSVNRLAAPEIGHVAEHFSDAHKIALEGAGGLEMRCEHEAAIGDLREGAALARHTQLCIERERNGGLGLEVRLGVDEGRRNGNPVRRRHDPCGQRIAVDIAHIAIGRELHPGPALLLVEQPHRLAHQGLGHLHRVKARRGMERDVGFGQLHQARLNEALRLHLADERCIGDVRAAGVKPRVKLGHGPSTKASRRTCQSCQRAVRDKAHP